MKAKKVSKNLDSTNQKEKQKKLKDTMLFDSVSRNHLLKTIKGKMRKIIKSENKYHREQREQNVICLHTK